MAINFLPPDAYVAVYKLVDDRYEDLEEGQEFVLSRLADSHEEAKAEGQRIGFVLEVELGATFSRVLTIARVPDNPNAYLFSTQGGQLQSQEVQFPTYQRVRFPDRPSEDHYKETKH